MDILISLTGTVLIYLVAKKVYRQTGKMIFSPMIVCPVVIISWLEFWHINYNTYNSGGQILTYLLQPATVALAVPIYKYKATLKKYLIEILAGVSTGTIVGIVGSMTIAYLFGFNSQIIISMAPRSITTPLAINVSHIIGGNSSLAAIFVILTGMLGAIICPYLFKLFNITSPITKGMMLGSSAHGIGTAKAYEIGELEGVISSLAMIFMGIATTIVAVQLAPWFLEVILRGQM